jgi:hypothetical protein
MTESGRIAKWLTATFKGDATLTGIVAGRVFNGNPPSGTARPYIKFDQLSSRDVQGNGTVRAMTRPLYQIVVVVDGPMSANSVAAADRMDAILQNTANETYDGVVLSIRRDSEIARPEQGPDPQQRYFNHGGIYRIDTQTA